MANAKSLKNNHEAATAAVRRNERKTEESGTIYQQRHGQHLKSPIKIKSCPKALKREESSVIKIHHNEFRRSVKSRDFEDKETTSF
ncbi:MAG: hypothetical protein R2783_06390 [Gelidibacter sp.]